MKKSTTDPLVLDGSVALAWLFHDEKNAYADKIIGKLPHLVFCVPRLWHLEISNVLLISERRGRCSAADSAQWFTFLRQLPILVDGETELRAWSDGAALARQHQLTAYDAAYLELAIRTGHPLATLDAKLESAAQAIGVSLYNP